MSNNSDPISGNQSRNTKVPSRSPVFVRGNRIGGSFEIVQDSVGEIVIKNPADHQDTLGKIKFNYKSVDTAVEAANESLKHWRLKSFDERSDFLQALDTKLENREGEIIEIMGRELGKPRWDAEQDIRSCREIVKGMRKWGGDALSAKRAGSHQERESVLAEIRPIGVVCVITGFSDALCGSVFRICSSIMMGNAVIFKPSERTPFLGQLLTEIFSELVSLDRGVVNLVQGDREVGRRLATHEGIHAILFEGSYEVASRIRQDTALQYWKRISVHTGGRNSAVVFADAEFDRTVDELILGAYRFAGQTGEAISRVFIDANVFEKYTREIHSRAKLFSIGYPLDNPFMGPMIEEGAMDRYFKFLGIAQREGCELIMRGKTLDGTGYKGNYVTPSICIQGAASEESIRKSVFHQSEFNGPNICLIPYSSPDSACKMINANQTGFLAAIFTKDNDAFARCSQTLDFGIILKNRSLSENIHALRFTGRKKTSFHQTLGPGMIDQLIDSVLLVDCEKNPRSLDRIPGLYLKSKTEKP